MLNTDPRSAHSVSQNQKAVLNKEPTAVSILGQPSKELHAQSGDWKTNRMILNFVISINF
jgi:hypothetical protein